MIFSIPIDLNFWVRLAYVSPILFGSAYVIYYLFTKTKKDLTMKVRKDHFVNSESTCPKCKEDLSAASGINTQEKPEPGDYSVCFYCGAILKFNSKLELDELSHSELMQLPWKTKKLLLITSKEIQENVKIEKEQHQAKNN